MLRIINSHSFRTLVRLLAFLILLFVLVNVLNK